MSHDILRVCTAVVFLIAGAQTAFGETLGSEGMETGATEVSGAQTEEAEEDSRSLGSDYYGSEPMKFLSNDGEGYTLKGVLNDESWLNFGGWASLGYTSRSTGMFNSDPSRINNHQSWFFLEKEADGSEGLDWGFRFDGMYGTDAGDTQSFGNRPGNWDFENGFDRGGGYGFAIPQLYAEVAYEDFSLIGGHFYTLLGYEVVTSPDNFFFSHAFTMYFSEAFTHTGALLNYSGLDMFEFYAGWTAGWDTGFDQFGGGSSFLGGASFTPIDEVSVTYILTGGNLGAIGDGYSHSIVVDTAPLPGLNYVLQSDYLTTNEDVLGSGNAGYSTIGINQYLMYSIFDELGVGARVEWWKPNGVSYYEATFGLNLRPLPNLIIRPEARWQWSPAANDDPGRNVAGLPVDEGAILGMDMIFTF
ncbi:MAG: outer membrane beta-barrel protein [Candidatus Binatia bacterium]|nr:outer membrane beta-barrel protein [Candidatus Binatia bacterium]